MRKFAFIALSVTLEVGMLFGQATNHQAESHPAKTTSATPHVAGLPPAAEQAMALLLAQARNVPQAHAALIAGKWERSKWEGVELHGKTLGVIGLGRVGALVAQRALAFGMRLLAYDPYVSPERARAMGVELRPLEELMAEADFVSIHLPKTPETVGLIGADLLAKVREVVGE